VLVIRGLLAVALIVCGSVILIRVLSLGLLAQSVPGIVLGGAMIALGVHRISLIVRVLRSA
jgi:hypothetical protein